jgi:hypothetical protein
VTVAEQERRITGWAAVAVVALMLPGIAVAVVYPAPSTAAAAALVAHLTAHRFSVLAAIYSSALGWGGGLLVFAGGLYAVLRRAEGERTALSFVAFGACVATSVAILTALTLFGTVAYRVPDIDPNVASLLYDAGAVANLMTAFPNAVYTIAAAIVIRRTSVLPAGIAHGALLVAAIHLASALSMARSGAFGPWGILASLAPLSHTAWLAAVAVATLRRGR